MDDKVPKGEGSICFSTFTEDDKPFMGFPEDNSRSVAYCKLFERVRKTYLNPVVVLKRLPKGYLHNLRVRKRIAKENLKPQARKVSNIQFEVEGRSPNCARLETEVESQLLCVDETQKLGGYQQCSLITSNTNDTFHVSIPVDNIDRSLPAECSIKNEVLLETHVKKEEGAEHLDRLSRKHATQLSDGAVSKSTDESERSAAHHGIAHYGTQAVVSDSNYKLSHKTISEKSKYGARGSDSDTDDEGSKVGSPEKALAQASSKRMWTLLKPCVVRLERMHAIERIIRRVPHYNDSIYYPVIVKAVHRTSREDHSQHRSVVRIHPQKRLKTIAPVGKRPANIDLSDGMALKRFCEIKSISLIDSDDDDNLTLPRTHEGNVSLYNMKSVETKGCVSTSSLVGSESSILIKPLEALDPSADSVVSENPVPSGMQALNELGFLEHESFQFGKEHLSESLWSGVLDFGGAGGSGLGASHDKSCDLQELPQSHLTKDRLMSNEGHKPYSGSIKPPLAEKLRESQSAVRLTTPEKLFPKCTRKREDMKKIGAKKRKITPERPCDSPSEMEDSIDDDVKDEEVVKPDFKDSEFAQTESVGESEFLSTLINPEKRPSRTKNNGMKRAGEMCENSKRFKLLKKQIALENERVNILAERATRELNYKRNNSWLSKYLLERKGRNNDGVGKIIKEEGIKLEPKDEVPTTEQLYRDLSSIPYVLKCNLQNRCRKCKNLHPCANANKKFQLFFSLTVGPGRKLSQPLIETFQDAGRNIISRTAAFVAASAVMQRPTTILVPALAGVVEKLLPVHHAKTIMELVAETEEIRRKEKKILNDMAIAETLQLKRALIAMKSRFLEAGTLENPPQLTHSDGSQPVNPSASIILQSIQSSQTGDPFVYKTNQIIALKSKVDNRFRFVRKCLVSVQPKDGNSATHPSEEDGKDSSNFTADGSKNPQLLGSKGQNHGVQGGSPSTQCSEISVEGDDDDDDDDSGLSTASTSDLPVATHAESSVPKDNEADVKLKGISENSPDLYQNGSCPSASGKCSASSIKDDESLHSKLDQTSTKPALKKHNLIDGKMMKSSDSKVVGTSSFYRPKSGLVGVSLLKPKFLKPETVEATGHTISIHSQANGSLSWTSPPDCDTDIIGLNERNHNQLENEKVAPENLTVDDPTSVQEKTDEFSSLEDMEPNSGCLQVGPEIVMSHALSSNKGNTQHSESLDRQSSQSVNEDTADVIFVPDKFESIDLTDGDEEALPSNHLPQWGVICTSLPELGYIKVKKIAGKLVVYDKAVVSSPLDFSSIFELNRFLNSRLTNLTYSYQSKIALEWILVTSGYINVKTIPPTNSLFWLSPSTANMTLTDMRDITKRHGPPQPYKSLAVPSPLFAARSSPLTGVAKKQFKPICKQRFSAAPARKVPSLLKFNGAGKVVCINGHKVVIGSPSAYQNHQKKPSSSTGKKGISQMSSVSSIKPLRIGSSTSAVQKSRILVVSGSNVSPTNLVCTPSTGLVPVSRIPPVIRTYPGKLAKPPNLQSSTSPRFYLVPKKGVSTAFRLASNQPVKVTTKIGPNSKPSPQKSVAYQKPISSTSKDKAPPLTEPEVRATPIGSTAPSISRSKATSTLSKTVVTTTACSPAISHIVATPGTVKHVSLPRTAPECVPLSDAAKQKTKAIDSIQKSTGPAVASAQPVSTAPSPLFSVSTTPRAPTTSLSTPKPVAASTSVVCASTALSLKMAEGLSQRLGIKSSDQQRALKNKPILILGKGHSGQAKSNLNFRSPPTLNSLHHRTPSSNDI